MTKSPFAALDFGQVQVQIQLHPITGDGMKVYLAEESARMKQLMSVGGFSGRKAVVIVDGSVSLVAPPEARRLQADWMHENQQLLAMVTHSLGFVVSNMLLRHAVSALMWIAPQVPFPTKTHASLSDAVRWAIDTVDSFEGEVHEDLRMGGALAVEAARDRVLRGVDGPGVSRAAG